MNDHDFMRRLAQKLLDQRRVVGLDDVALRLQAGPRLPACSLERERLLDGLDQKGLAGVEVAQAGGLAGA
jgi:hypothetical protein